MPADGLEDDASFCTRRTERVKGGSCGISLEDNIQVVKTRGKLVGLEKNLVILYTCALGGRANVIGGWPSIAYVAVVGAVGRLLR